MDGTRWGERENHRLRSEEWVVGKLTNLISVDHTLALENVKDGQICKGLRRGIEIACNRELRRVIANLVCVKMSY